MSKTLIWKKDDYNWDALGSFCDGYIDFISECKTERECVSAMIEELKGAGALSMEELESRDRAPKPNELIYTHMMNKALMVFRIGKRPLTDGFRILGAHIDSPRLDLKQHPVYEDHDLAFLDTHYYGGIKKYQWMTIPLAIHGVAARKDGSVEKIVFGESELDSVLSIADLLPHLGKSQMEKKLADAIPGEKLNVLCGSIPKLDEENEFVKKGILANIKGKFNIEEDDFISSEFELVPAGRARDLGFDRSMILGYGQDDRVCAYTSFKAIMDQENPEYTSVCVFTDKEEIGSVGATGAASRFFEDTVAELLDTARAYTELALRKTLRKSKVLSSDVSAGFDPNFPDVYEANNSCYLGYGPVFNKYTGARGKSGSNDANAEYIAFLRNLLDSEAICYQTSELGKVDEGGGGTIAYLFANLGMEVIDFGVPVLSMHAPHEVTSKADIYEAYRAYKCFLK